MSMLLRTPVEGFQVEGFRFFTSVVALNPTHIYPGGPLARRGGTL